MLRKSYGVYSFVTEEVFVKGVVAAFSYVFVPVDEGQNRVFR
jgi:hypothetical protein